jgi:hypothetical protein
VLDPAFDETDRLLPIKNLKLPDTDFISAD